MRRAALLALSSFLLGLLFACGGGGNDDNGGEEPPPPAPVSGLKPRAFVSNEFANQLHIMEASTDRASQISIPAGSRPGLLGVSPDKKLTVVFAAGNAALVAISNSIEQPTASVFLGDWTESFVFAPDSKRLFAAVRNFGRVVEWNLENGSTEFINVTAVRRLVLNQAGTHLLAFSDESDALTVIDPVTRSTTTVAGFDRPVWGVFTDDSHALILSCGPQCGGTEAQVTQLDLSTTPPTAGASVPVSAATIGVLEGGKLYVAGTAAGGGRLDVVETGTLTVAKSGVVISDGYHHVMALAGNNRLFIGARTCNNITNGCLSIFNTGAQTAVIGTPKGEVTGMQPIAGRNMVYVGEGGDLRFYDTTTDAEVLPAPINFSGKIIDVIAVD